MRTWALAPEPKYLMMTTTMMIHQTGTLEKAATGWLLVLASQQAPHISEFQPQLKNSLTKFNVDHNWRSTPRVTGYAPLKGTQAPTCVTHTNTKIQRVLGRLRLCCSTAIRKFSSAMVTVFRGSRRIQRNMNFVLGNQTRVKRHFEYKAFSSSIWIINLNFFPSL